MLLVLIIITGFIYPLFITGVAQVFFPWKANGSIVVFKGKKIGSVLIGQPFTSDAYFWGRPSATTPHPYNGASSSGSNAGPSNPAYIATVQERVNQLNKYKQNSQALIPVDLITASGSGLDPEISPLSAYFQISRVAKARKLPENVVTQIVRSHIQERSGKLLGEPRVNVMQLNLALDSL